MPCLQALPASLEVQIAKKVQVRASLVVQTVKNLPAMQETCVQSLGWEDPLEKGKNLSLIPSLPSFLGHAL